MDTKAFVQIELPVASKVRTRLHLKAEEFSLNGHFSLNNQNRSQELVHILNKERTEEDKISAGDLFGAAVIQSALRLMIKIYEKKNPESSAQLLEDLNSKYPDDFKESTYEILDFIPDNYIYFGKESIEQRLQKEINGKSTKLVALENLMLLQLANRNIAFKQIKPLFDDSQDIKQKPYNTVMRECELFYQEIDPVPGFDDSLLDLLHKPMAYSTTIKGQLEYILENWADILGDFIKKILMATDLIAEENKFRGLGPGPAEGVDFSFIQDDTPRFSPDSDWMPKVILLAKNALVWLFQLSQKYGREISRLDHIPDEELDNLASKGFTSIWLIGLWERSNASQKIKKSCGNPEAEASAYSLYNYRIAARLGGAEALDNLKERASFRSIRIASDMVPNHCGIDSEWIRNRPDYFLSLTRSPFPQYSFNSQNLSDDENISIQIEDKYYTQEDCAVVFRRVDKNTGKELFIYHGNDGTSMPWNDTAQINFLNPDAREAVIQEILHVARHTPIIRFDAAMTLAKKHIQRLWFPEPGKGGDIPTRSQYGAMTAKEFHNAIPKEFWQEVVERIASEAPDTLLLAEAFWMMEGYFVRNLGMHRVYNSAFMNMTKNEDNKSFKDLLKKTLKFDPEILKRYVNFMNNPDEDTAYAQFGDGDKYFGVCSLMMTLPGLPMVGHGQFEGYKEKYGMEYSRPYYDEKPNEGFINEHINRISPIMKRRFYFADACCFHLYDFYLSNGSIDENVYAYSNQYQSAYSLFLFNNCHIRSDGWINRCWQHSLQLPAALGLEDKDNCYMIMKEQFSGLWFIRSNRKLFSEGLHVELNGYQAQLFWDIYQVNDNGLTPYGELHRELNGRGIPDINQALKDIRLRPVHELIKQHFNSNTLSNLITRLQNGKTATKTDSTSIKKWIKRLKFKWNKDQCEFLPENYLTKRLKSVCKASKKFKRWNNIKTNKESLQLAIWAYMSTFGKIVGYEDNGISSLEIFEEWSLENLIQKLLEETEFEYDTIRTALREIEIAFTFQKIYYQSKHASVRTLKKVFHNDKFSRYCQVNLYDGHYWFNKESFESITKLIFLFSYCELNSTKGFKLFKKMRLKKLFKQWLKASKISKYRVKDLVKTNLI